MKSILTICAITLALAVLASSATAGSGTGSCSASPNPVGQHAEVTISATGLTPSGTYLLTISKKKFKITEGLITVSNEGTTSYLKSTEGLEPGTYTAVFTASPSQHLAVSKASCDFPVLANERPVPVIQASTTSGTGPLTVNFDGTGSYDPDGSIVAYRWSFGSVGGPTTPTASYRFEPAFDPETGERLTVTYTVYLHVWDNLNSQANTAVTITVS